MDRAAIQPLLQHTEDRFPHLKFLRNLLRSRLLGDSVNRDNAPPGVGAMTLTGLNEGASAHTLHVNKGKDYKSSFRSL